jgi:hypothetical protein
MAGLLPDEAKVVRGGVATSTRLQKGVAEHIQVPGLTGFSVQSAAGKTVGELARAGEVPHRRISVTTVGQIRAAGRTMGVDVDVVPSPGRGYHATVKTPLPLPDDLAEALSKIFVQQPNPHPKTR